MEETKIGIMYHEEQRFMVHLPVEDGFKDLKWCQVNGALTQGATYGTSIAPIVCPNQIP